MADVKISQLPAATTPVDGTEVLPIVQSATTKQVSIANLTAGRAMAASSLTLTTPLAVTSGGTGLATVAQGALLSATAADTISATRTPTLGLAGTAAGTLGLSGSTSGVVTLQTAAAAGTWSMTLPTSGGTNGYILTTNGSGVTQWTNPTALGIDLDVGSTAITGGTTGRVLYNNAGVLGEYSVTGTGSVVLGTTPTFTTSALFPAGTVSAPGISVSGDTNTGIYFPAADTIGFVEGGVESMRLDSSGNLGLGVTPSAWNTSQKVLQFGPLGYLRGGASASEIGSNAYFNASSQWVYQTAAAATRLEQNSGAFNWFTAASGSAGSTISFTQAMTLDASGDLTVNAGNIWASASSTTVQIRPTTGAAYIGTTTNSVLGLITNYTESARIDASGNLLVGTTSAGTGGNGFKVQPAGNGAGIPITILSGNTNNDANGAYHVYSTSDAAYKFYATYAGKIYAVTTTVQAITSDVNLKTDITDYDYGLDEVCAMKPRYFKYKTDLTTRHAGFIAQEMEEAIPGSMIDAIDGKNKTYSADWYPILVKAIQELAAKVSALEARQ